MVFAVMANALAQNSFKVSFNELPKDIQKYVGKNFKGYNIDKAVQEQNEKGKPTSYDVYVSKGSDKERLIFDKDGEFVKKEAVTEQQAAPMDTSKKQ